jgi:tetratricopeptide (TPR) repeat protein
MAYTKKKQRKKRKPQQYEAPMTDEEKAKIQYKDDFQKNIGSQVEDFGKKFEGKGKQIMYALAGLGVLLILLGIYYTYQKRQNNAAQAALGSAIETSQAQVTDTPQPAGVTIKTFKTEKERAEASIKEFEQVINNFGGDYAEKAKYFIAVSRLALDREAGINELQALTGNAGEVGHMSKFALAQVKNDDGKYDEAVKLYQELIAVDNPTISKDTINFELAKIYEKQEKTKEAVDIYFNIAKEASEAKDADDKPIPLTQTAREAKEKLEALDPEKAKEIKEPETPPSSLPLG